MFYLFPHTVSLIKDLKDVVKVWTNISLYWKITGGSEKQISINGLWCIAVYHTKDLL